MVLQFAVKRDTKCILGLLDLYLNHFYTMYMKVFVGANDLQFAMLKVLTKDTCIDSDINNSYINANKYIL